MTSIFGIIYITIRNRRIGKTKIFSLSCFGIYAYAILSMAYICLSESQQ